MIKSSMRFIAFCTRCLVQSFYNTIDHDGVEYAGYMAYLLMLAIFPFLVIFVAIVGFMGKAYLGHVLSLMILDSHWAMAIEALKPRIMEITSHPPQSLLTIAILSAVWTASSILEGLRTILNKTNQDIDERPYVWRRIASIFEFFLLLGVVMLVMIFLVIIPNILEYISGFLIINKIISHNNLVLIGPDSAGVRYILLIVFSMGLISSLYHFLPMRQPKFRSTLPGSIFVLGGWFLFSEVFQYYIQAVPSINIIYGSLTGIIVALLYFYICSFIFIMGAEINHYIAKANKI